MINFAKIWDILITKFPAFMEGVEITLQLAFFTVLFGSLLGLVFHLPAWIVFLALKCDEIFKCGIALWRLSGDKWLRDVTR